MTATVPTTVTMIDLAEPLLRSDPYPRWSALREAGPVHRDVSGAWLVVRHDAVNALLRDARLGKDLRRWRGYSTARPYGAGSIIERYIEQWMKSRLPPAHARWRRLVGQGFTARAVAGLRAQMAAFADRLLDAVPRDQPFDLMSRFAYPFPLGVIAQAMGLPWGDSAELQGWSQAIGHVLEPGSAADVRERGDRALEELLDFLREQVEDHRRRPREDLLSRLIAVEDESASMSNEELIATILLLFLSGNETSANLIANGLLALLRNPAEAERLRRQPELMARAVEELLRYDGPACIVVRASYEPIEIEHTVIPDGELVLLVLASANRDAAALPDPDRLDIGRERVPHLAFGGGDHHCIGSALARLEGQVALERLLARFPALQHDEASLRWMDTHYLRGLEHMTVSIDEAGSHGDR